MISSIILLTCLLVSCLVVVLGDMVDLQTIDPSELKKLGIHFYRSGDYDKAAGAFHVLASKEPEKADNHAYLGNVYYRKGDLEKAAEGYRKAIEINPNEARFHSNLGTLYVTSAQYELATEIFERAMELSPGDGTMKKNRDGARMQLKAAVIRDDIMSGSTTRLEEVFEGRGYTNAEEIAFRVAVDAYPEILKGAVGLLRGCIERVPKFAIARHLLGDILLDYRDRREGPEWEERNKALTDEVRKAAREANAASVASCLVFLYVR